jgi:uncharacterized protein (DUF1697 family)
MAQYFAFLRGINVGGHTLKMDRLRQLFAAHGFEQPETFIASGNVVFECATTDDESLSATIEAFLEADLGYGVATFVRTADELAAIVRRIGVHERELSPGDSLYLGFLRTKIRAADRRQVEALSNDVDHLSVDGRELYWQVRGKFGDSTLGGYPGGPRLEPITFRNVTTVRKLAAKYGVA